MIQQEESSNNSYNFENKNILIIEDEDNYINTIVKILKSTQCNIFIFDLDGQDDVINCIKNNKIDLVLVDIILTNGYNGRDLIREIKEYDKDIPTVALTSQNSNEDMELTIQMGTDLHLKKPINKKILLKSLHLFLD